LIIGVILYCDYTGTDVYQRVGLEPLYSLLPSSTENVDINLKHGMPLVMFLILRWSLLLKNQNKDWVLWVKDNHAETIMVILIVWKVNYQQITYLFKYQHLWCFTIANPIRMPPTMTITADDGNPSHLNQHHRCLPFMANHTWIQKEEQCHNQNSQNHNTPNPSTKRYMHNTVAAILNTTADGNDDDFQLSPLTEPTPLHPHTPNSILAPQPKADIDTLSDAIKHSLALDKAKFTTMTGDMTAMTHLHSMLDTNDTKILYFTWSTRLCSKL